METTLGHEYVLDSVRTYPATCRACGEVEVVPTSVKTAKNEPSKRLIYMRCRACHQRWQDAVTTGT